MGEARHTQVCIPRAWHALLMRFRLGVWLIEANKPRGATGQDRDRAEIFCPICLAAGCPQVEDERHVLLECGAYEDIRSALWAQESTPVWCRRSLAMA